MKLKSGYFLILASIVIALVGVIPWKANQDSSLLLPALLMSGVLFLAGIVSLLKRAYHRLDHEQQPEVK